MNNYFKVGPERNGPDSNEITVINKILKSPRILQKNEIFRPPTQEKSDDDSFVPPLPDYDPILPPPGFKNNKTNIYIWSDKFKDGHDEGLLITFLSEQRLWDRFPGVEVISCFDMG